MKKSMAWILMLCLLASMMAGCGGSETDDTRQPDAGNAGQQEQNDPQTQSGKYQPGIVAEELDTQALSQPPVNGLQDLYYWADDDTEYRSEPSEMDDKMVHSYKTDMDTVKAYITMLQKNGWTLVDTEEGYKGGYYSWGLTCDAAPEAETIGQMFTETPCHLSIHWTDSERYRFTFYVSEDIKVCDMGLRQEGGNACIAPAGQSACAGLERLADGSYRTTDGRLTASVNSAMVIRDGETYTVDAAYENDGSFQMIRVEYYYRDEGFLLRFPENSLMEGDLYRLEDLDKYRANEASNGDSADSMTYDYLQVWIAHDDKWITPGRNDDTYEALTVRVMYMDRGGDIVFYVCAMFDDDQPELIEALVAVDSSAVTGEVRDATYLKVGDQITLEYHPHVTSESYTLFTWEVIEGDENVWIDGSGTSCTVRALDAGSAVIRVTYEYTEEGNNVLTGNPENQPRSATQDYYFIIE